MYCTAPLSPRKGCLISFHDDDDDDDDESGYLYAAPNSLFSHNGAGRWFTHAGKAESSAGA